MQFLPNSIYISKICIFSTASKIEVVLEDYNNIYQCAHFTDLSRIFEKNYFLPPIVKYNAKICGIYRVLLKLHKLYLYI
uniref:CBS domain-containing protein n=1 Tax=Strongyloides papillosus TaxID=174720 RepID=A0A0N5B8D8_STREA